MEDNADIPSQKSDMIDESQEHIIHPNQVACENIAVSEQIVPNEQPSVQKQSIEESTVLSEKIEKQSSQPNLHQYQFIEKQKSISRREKYWHTHLMSNLDLYFKNPKLAHNLNQKLNQYSIIQDEDGDRKKFQAIFLEMNDSNNFAPEKLSLTLKQSRGIGAVMGMGIGDALGSCTQFQHFRKEGLGIVKNGFSDLAKIYSRSGKFNIWTDDASMGLCMADCLLLNNYQFNPKHMRYLFILWLEHGLNNGGRPYSIGLGGNISISMYEFMRKQEDYTDEGDRFNNGNGSLMRLAPVPVGYADSLEDGVKYSGLQSKTTHNGLQAEQCSRLMGNIIIELINRAQGEDGKKVIEKVCNDFKANIPSVSFLAKSMQQPQEYYKQCCSANRKFKTFNKKPEDRNWNWKDESFTYSPCRYKQQPGYIGSYCMDALAMALHTVWHSQSFFEVVVKNADMGGDCDTVGSIAGQIAGALWGIDQKMLKLYSQMEDFHSKRFDLFLKGYKLINKKSVGLTEQG